MKRFFRNVFNYGKYVVAILLSIFAIVEIIDFFGLASLGNVGGVGIILLIVTSIVFCVCKFVLEKHSASDEEQIAIREIDQKIANRIGVLKSSEKPAAELMDAFHRITLIERIDILDYDTKDYLSYRVINGVNDYKRNSPYFKYKESTDSKTASAELLVKAYDRRTGKELKVVFLEKEQKVYVHNFKILFSTPLKHNEEFSIMYFIKIPNELGQLSDSEEMMSISLNRFSKKIEKLNFSVYLNFSPSSVETYRRGEDGRTDAVCISPKIKDKSVYEDVDEVFHRYLSGTHVRTKISISLEKPEKQTYIILYRK